MRSASPPADAALARAAAPLPWPTIGLCFAAMFFLMGSRAGFAVFYPRMVTDAGWSLAEVTGAYSVGLFVYAPIAVAAGVFVDRFGCRLSMLVGCASLAVGLGIVAGATELWHLYVGFVLANGIAPPGIGFVTVVKLLSMRAGARFSTAFGLAFTGQGVGSLVLSPAIQVIVDAAGWRFGALTIVAGVLVVLAPLALLIAPGPDRAAERASSASPEGIGPGPLIFVIFVLSNAGLGYLMLIPTHQVAHLLDRGFAPEVAATAAGAWGLMTSLGSLGGGWALDRWGLAGMLSVACVLFALGTAAVIVAGPEVVGLLAAYVVASGAGRGMLSVVLSAAQTRAYAGPRLGRVTGLMDLGFGSGAFLGPWLAALARERDATFAFGFGSSIASAGLMAATAFVASRYVAAWRARQ